MPTTIPSAADWAAFAGAPAAAARLIAPDAGERVRAFGNEVLFKLVTGETNGAFSLGLSFVSASTSAVPLHIHDNEDEMFIIVQGTYRVFVNDAWSDCGPGSVVYFPRGVMHTFYLIGGEDGRHWVVTTSNAFRDYFTRAGEIFAAGGVPDRARLAALGAQYGMRFVKADGAGADVFAVPHAATV